MKIREILLEILDLGYLRGPPLHSLNDFSYSCLWSKSIFSGNTRMYKLENSDAEMLPRILAAYYVVALAASLMKHSAVCYRWVKILYYTFHIFFQGVNSISKREYHFHTRHWGKFLWNFCCINANEKRVYEKNFIQSEFS